VERHADTTPKNAHGRSRHSSSLANQPAQITITPECLIQLREKPVLGHIWDTNGFRTRCAPSRGLTGLRIRAEDGLGKVTLDISQLQPIDIGRMGSGDSGRPFSDDERRTTVPGRSEFRADTHARNGVRDEVMVGNEERGEVKLLLDELEMNCQKTREAAGREGKNRTFISAGGRWYQTSSIVSNAGVPYKQEMSYSLATAPAGLQNQ
jgi:hypothetical protein